MAIVPGRQYHCTNCGRCILDVTLDGQPAHVVVVLQVAPIPGGAPFDADRVRVPDFIRRAFHLPQSAMELCLDCMPRVFRLPVLPPVEVTPDDFAQVLDPQRRLATRDAAALPPEQKDVLLKSEWIQSLAKPPKTNPRLPSQAAKATTPAKRATKRARAAATDAALKQPGGGA